MRWFDGAFLGGDSPQLPAGIGAFESMAAVGGSLPLWRRHLQRLQAAAARLQLPFAPPPDLAAAAAELLLHNNDQDGALRLALLPGPHWELTSRRRAPAPRIVRLIPTVQRRPAGAPPADLKATPRPFYDAVRQEAQAGAADDGVILGDDGAVLETATANLFLLLDGSWCTPPLDGRILPGIARAVLLERAAAAGLPIAERACDLADLHRASQLAVSNAVHGPRPAYLVRAGGDPVQPFDTPLQPLWRDALAD